MFSAFLLLSTVLIAFLPDMYGASDSSRQLMDRLKNLQHCAGQDLLDQLDNGRLPSDIFYSSLTNERCGDSVRLFLRISADGVVQEALHQTAGCSICRLAADFLCQTALGRESSALLTLAEAVRQWQTDPQAPLPPVHGLSLFSDIRGRRNRARCLMLPWEALYTLPGTIPCRP